MRSLFKLSILPLLGIVLASCGGSNGDNSWVHYTSPQGAFSVSFPSQPKTSEKTEVTAFGKQVVHFVTWRPKTFSIDKFKLFEVSYTDCPARFISDSLMTDIMLDSSIRIRKRDFTDRDISTQPIDLNGYPGRSFMYEIPHDNNEVIVKQCITNNRRYDLVVIARRDQGTNPEIAEFFNSFTALK